MYPIIDFGTVHIPSFFLVISVGLSILLFYLSIRVEKFKRNRKQAFDLAIILMVSGFVGGRLMHVFFEEWPYYSMQLSRIFEFWRGGFAFTGGIFFCIGSGWLYCKIKNINFSGWADFFAPLVSLAHAIGRIGCLLSGCCFGASCDLPWAMDGRHPTVLYLLFGELIIFAILLYYENSDDRLPSGHLFLKWLLLHSVLRLNVEYFRADERGTIWNVPIIGPLSNTQIVSLAIIAFTVAVFVRKKYTRQNA